MIIKKFGAYLVALLLALSAVPAQASFLIEPYLGYTVIGDGESQSSSTTQVEFEYNGIGYGARLGLQYFGLMAGGEYAMASAKVERKTSTGTTDEDEFDSKTMGIFVGYNFPIMLRIWGTYFFDAETEDQDAAGNTQTGDSLSGTGVGVGIGYTALPFISLNLEYRTQTYDEFKDSSTGTVTQLGTAEIKQNQIMLSVSLPFEI